MPLLKQMALQQLVVALNLQRMVSLTLLGCACSMAVLVTCAVFCSQGMPCCQ